MSVRLDPKSLLFFDLFSHVPCKKRDAKLFVSAIRTLLGPMIVAASDDGLHMLEFTDRKDLTRGVRDLSGKFGKLITRAENDLIREAEAWLTEYFEGRSVKFKGPIDPIGTPFRREVWGELRNIPFGQAISYQDLAISLGKPSASRAVAGAVSSNPIALIIPCHRVIGKNGNLVGYSGGLERKSALLNHEKDKHMPLAAG